MRVKLNGKWRMKSEKLKLRIKKVFVQRTILWIESSLEFYLLLFGFQL